MVRLTIGAIHLFCAVLLFSSTVFSNDLNTGGHPGLVRTLSTETLGTTGFNFGGALKYSTEYDYIAGPHGASRALRTSNNTPVSQSTPHLFSGNIYTAYGITRYWDFALDLPVYSDIPGWNDIVRNGIGDLELTTKMTYPFGREKAWLTNAYFLKVLLPTGQTQRGFFPRHVYYLTKNSINDSDAVFALKTVYFNPQVIWSADFSKINRAVPLLLHVNFGGVVASKKSNSIVVAAVGLEYRPHKLITLFTEISGESRVQWYTDHFTPADFTNDPFRVTPGFRINLPKGIYMVFSGDYGIAKESNKYRTNFNRNGYAYSTKSIPRYSAQFALGWQGIAIEPDRDNDGVPDKKDLCLMVPEDKDGFKDDDGCPDIDNDNDGILDVRDSCPLEAAVCSGCPILDTDNDGINDDVDLCRHNPEDRDNYNDNDGCPEPDNDGDGINDENDTCPNKAEDVDGFEDNDGCPDLDNDGDGVLDSSDKCPAVKGYPDNNGCPRTEEIKRGKLILSGVNFESGKSLLTESSFSVLDRVYESLVEWPDVKIEIRGHTDNIGDATYNQRLSQARAESVMNYLLRKGISSERLKAIGLGESLPIATNSSAAGRAQNRRVEMKRID